MDYFDIFIFQADDNKIKALLKNNGITKQFTQKNAKGICYFNFKTGKHTTQINKRKHVLFILKIEYYCNEMLFL